MEKHFQVSARTEMSGEKTYMKKPFSELSLIDDFMFDVATSDLEICKYIVELSMNIKIREIRWKEGQKQIHNLPGKRGIRLDFYVVDMKGTIYNVEMQNRREGNIPKRTRFYKALLDSPVLKTGEKGFDKLPPTFIIFICSFDLFGYEKYRYTFETYCREVTGLTLQDDLHTIFLNTKGKNPQEVEPALVEFLKFVENSSEETAENSEDERIKSIYQKVAELKRRADLEMSYMKMEERDRMIEERGVRRGTEIGKEIGERNKLVSLVKKKREKGMTAVEIAELLEEEEAVICGIFAELEKESVGKESS